MIKRRRFIGILGAALGVGVLGAAPFKPRETVWRGRAFGADAHIVLRGEGAATALDAALDTIRRMESYFSIYDPGSLISQLNRTGHLETPPEFARLIGDADLVHRKTDGLFDPTIQPLFAAKLTEEIQPSPAAIGWQHVLRSGSDLHFAKAGMAITLNGIAQGFATDRVSEVLAAHGFADTQINIGEYRVGSEPLRLAVQDVEGRTLANRLVRNAAVATSSQNGFTFGDGTGHILSPSGFAAPIWNTVSVLADTATIADGCSTALILAPDAKLARKLVSEKFAKAVILQDMEGKVQEI